MIEELKSIKEELFDAPADVKSAFNEVCQYFAGKGKSTKLDDSKDYKEAWSLKKYQQNKLNNNGYVPTIVNKIPESYYYIGNAGALGVGTGNWDLDRIPELNRYNNSGKLLESIDGYKLKEYKTNNGSYIVLYPSMDSGEVFADKRAIDYISK